MKACKKCGSTDLKSLYYIQGGIPKDTDYFICMVCGTVSPSRDLLEL